MSGLYLHIPFCRQACNYCDFHFSTTLNLKSDLLLAMQKEIIARKDEALQEVVSTIYLGGGTPSLLTRLELDELFACIYSNYNVSHDAEITIEANPDDLNKDYLNNLRLTPVNRLSIGIQSFRESDLRFMNRVHTADEAEDAVRLAADAGFDNISIDLIYGTPGLDTKAWEENLLKAFALPVQHLSAYCLTVEEGTALAYQVKKGLAAAVNDEHAAEQFAVLLAMTKNAGIPWYEVSNFARPGFESKHNSAYWNGVPYIGIGPSAHSYSGSVRSWNIANNVRYIRGMMAGESVSDKEQLSTEQHMNEIILTKLRTRKGLTAADIRDEMIWKKLVADAAPFVMKGKVMISDTSIQVTEEGLLFADGIARDLFI